MIFKPHPYQQYCIDQVLQKPAIGLFLDMGLGKTSITLSAISELKYGRFEVQRVLVIAPKKVQKPHGSAKPLNGIISSICGFRRC